MEQKKKRVDYTLRIMAAFNTAVPRHHADYVVLHDERCSIYQVITWGATHEELSSIRKELERHNFTVVRRPNTNALLVARKKSKKPTCKTFTYEQAIEFARDSKCLDLVQSEQTATVISTGKYGDLILSMLAQRLDSDVRVKRYPGNFFEMVQTKSAAASQIVVTHNDNFVTVPIQKSAVG